MVSQNTRSLCIIFNIMCNLYLSFPAMVRGWWWIKDPEELYNTLQALHPRGIRERVLHKHLAKHMESLAEMCTKPISGEWCCVVEFVTEDFNFVLLHFSRVALSSF